MENDGWLTLADASDRLGCSIDTLRRRLKRGELEATQVKTRYGLVWEVRLGEMPTVGSTPMHDNQPQELGQLVALVRDLHQENRELAEAASMWQGRADILQHQLSEMKERVLMLEAPKV